METHPSSPFTQQGAAEVLGGPVVPSTGPWVCKVVLGGLLWNAANYAK